MYKFLETEYTTFKKRAAPDEADTENDFISHILDHFKIFYSRQKPPSKAGRTDIFDFVLFKDEKDKDDFVAAAPKDRPWGKGIAILEAKRWGRALDKGDATDPLDPKVPLNQMLRYMSMAERASNRTIVWGILTNGIIWRMYSQRASDRASEYYEIDLKKVFEDGAAPSDAKAKEHREEQVKLFFLFFNVDAYVPTAWRTAESFLQISVNEGKRLEQKVSDDLKSKIFSRITTSLATGFLDDMKNKKKGLKVTQEILNEIYVKNLTYLYRLIFLFYAEDRALLPILSPSYKNYSLKKMRDDVADSIASSVSFSKSSTVYFDKLKSLFAIINKGDASIQVPQYNGGLFDPGKNPFLDKDFCIPDYYLAPAIDQMGMERNPGVAPRKINYQQLSVRQLGHLYEGLLEFNLLMAETDLIVVVKKGKEYFCPYKGKGEIVVKEGELYIANNKTERHSTGSYYTDDKIVQIILRHTIDPLVRKLKTSFSAKKDSLFADDKLTAMQKNTELLAADLVQQVLNIKLLDPATGSGHFLISAVDYLSDKLLEIIDEFSEKNYFGTIVYRSPILELLDTIRKDIKDTASLNHFEVDEDQLDDKNLLKRLILKKCIYGVDVNYLAVELAKVSCWLHTFTIGAPLSFLNHHIKCGNSLVNIDPDVMTKRMIEDLYFLTMNTRAILPDIKALSSMADFKIDQVEESERLFKEIGNLLAPWKHLFDLTLYDKFTNGALIKLMAIIEDQSNKGISPIKLMADLSVLAAKERTRIEEALNLARRQGFFHWSLEFPEVFFPETEPPGFTIIYGNPPYINSKTMQKVYPDVRSYLKKNCKNLIENWDIYVAFMQRGYELLSKDGILSFIVPDAFIREKYASRLRELLKKLTTDIDYFPNMFLFPDATVHNIILTFRKAINKAGVAKTLYSSLEEKPETRLEKDPDKVFRDYDSRDVTLKRENFVPLSDICYISKGMVLNAKDPEYKGEFKKKDITSMKRTAICNTELIQGKNVNPYTIRGHKYLEWGTARVPGHLDRPTFVQLHAPRTLVTNKLGRLKVAINDAGHKSDQTVRILARWDGLKGVENNSIHKSVTDKITFRPHAKKKEKDNLYLEFRKSLEKIGETYDPSFLLGLLNSSCCKFIFYGLRGDSSFDINPDILRQIPIPRLDRLTDEDMTNAITAAKAIEAAVKGGSKHSIIDGLKKKLDALVYDIYGLSPEDRSLVEEYITKLERAAEEKEKASEVGGKDEDADSGDEDEDAEDEDEEAGDDDADSGDGGKEAEDEP